MVLALSAPQRPRSAVTMITRARSPSRCSRYGCRYSVASSAVVSSTSIIFSAYGRVACTVVWARRSLVAATTCIALVIFWVFCMLRMRRRTSRREGNGLPLLHPELLVEGLDHFLDLALDVLVPLPVVLERVDERPALGVQEAVEGVLPLGHPADGHAVQEAAGAGVDGADLDADVHRLELA